MVELTLEAQILQFILNGILLGTGGLVTYLTIHRYQRIKERKEVRENLVKDFNTVRCDFFTLMILWNAFIDDVTSETYNTKQRNLRNELEVKFMEFNLSMQSIISRMVIRFELDETQEIIFKDFREAIERIASLIEDIVYKRQETGEIITDFYLLPNHMKNIVPLILEAKIR
ncbi:MAG: hypothetical protein ACXAEU_07380 [Candidatus Hodarchaeales archaeon]